MARVHEPVAGVTWHGPKSELRANLLRLSEACPFDQTNPQDCPLFPLRQMRFGSRVQWVNALTEDDMGFLVAYHQVCLGIRVESGWAMQGKQSRVG